MAPASNEEQFKFLISCIRYSNNGKVRNLVYSTGAGMLIFMVDFGQVAHECKIVSGAAYVPFEFHPHV